MVYILKNEYLDISYDDNAKWLSSALFDETKDCKFRKILLL